MQGVEENVPEIVPSYSHLRPVLVHRTQFGFSSPHLTLRILECTQYSYLADDKKASTYLQVLQPSLDLSGLIGLLKAEDILASIKSSGKECQIAHG